ncbi:hypothetical protein D6745_03190 [Candidatus Woesearchaeota archaeon]|nr:MAG: hypothetical protein D6745_03190 [Candidatus Woesearchaeota archaeon]
MKKVKQVVLFTRNNARIFYTDNVKQFGNLDIVVNPDLSLVKGLPPHYWKKKGNKIVPMSKSEMNKRYKQIKESMGDVPLSKRKLDGAFISTIILIILFFIILHTAFKVYGI